MFKLSKVILFGILLTIILSTGGTVFAVDLELNYPTIPGVGNIEKGQDIEDKGEKMAFYARYVLRLAFYIVLGICIIVLIAAGIMYITAGAKPATVVAAKLMVQRAFLGLFILVASYSVLYLINPQLLIVQVDFQEPEDVSFVSTVISGEAGVIRGYSIDQIYIASTTLEEAADELYYYGDGDIRNDYDSTYRPIVGGNNLVSFVPKQGLFAKILDIFTPDTAFADDAEVEPMVYRSELPLRRTKAIIDKIVELVEGVKEYIPPVIPGNPPTPVIISYGIEDLLQDCECGESKYHEGWSWKGEKTGKTVKTYSAIFEGECIGGMSEADRTIFLEENGETTQNICLTLASDCGTAVYETDEEGLKGKLKCDIRDVVVKQIPVSPSFGVEETIEVVFIKTIKDSPKTRNVNETKWQLIDWNPIGWKPAVGWKPSGAIKVEDNDAKETDLVLAADASIDKERSIKYKRFRLQKLVAQLEGMKDTYFPEQVGPVDKTLQNNAADYTVFNGLGMFGNDFVIQKKEWEDKGYTVEIEPLKSANSALEEPLLAVEPEQSRFGKLLSFFITPVSAKLQQYRIVGTKYFIITEAPEGVLPKSLLDRNQLVRREAGRASLFSVLTDLTLERIQEMFQMCLTSAFGVADYKVSDENITNVIENSLAGGAGDAFLKEIKENMPEIIAGIGKTYGNVFKNKIDKECTIECGDDDNCKNECIKENIDPNFTSKIVTEFLTADIDTWFGDNVKEGLDSRIRDILGDDVNTQLDKPMGRFYDAIFRGLLSESIEDKVPKLKGILETKLTEVKFLDVVLGNLAQVDDFLTCRISGCCRPVNSEAECIQEDYNEFAGGEIKQCGNAEIGFRNVASKHQCMTEVYRDKDGKKECCEQGLRQVIDVFAEDKIKSLARQYTTQKSAELIDGLRGKMPGFFPEFAKAEDCHLEKGYFFDQNPEFFVQFPLNVCVIDVDFSNGGPGTCIRLTPENINILGTGKYTTEWKRAGVKKDPDNDNCFIPDLAPSLIKTNRREEICIGAGYYWGRDPERGDIYEGDGDKLCSESSGWIGGGIARGDGISGIGDRLGRQAVAGLINFGEQFISALVEITLHTSIAYAKMWIEDTVVAPLLPYFRQVMNFQDKLHEYLTASVKDVLPNTVQDTLEKNLDTIIGDLCRLYREQKDGGETTIKFAEYDWLQWDDPDTAEVDYKPISFQVTDDIGKTFGEGVCKFDTHLHTTLLDEIAADTGEFGENAVKILNETIKERIDVYCEVETGGKTYKCSELFEMNLAEMLFTFTPLKNITELIQATPKEMICGEKHIKWIKDGKELYERPKTVCEKIQYTGSLENLIPDRGLEPDFYKQLLSPINLVLPFINADSQTYKDLSEKGKKFYQGYCPAVVWGICKPISISDAIKNQEITIGGAIKQLLIGTCNTFAETLENGVTVKDEKGQVISAVPPFCIQGKCLSQNALDPELDKLQQDNTPQCLPAFKNTCSGCNTIINNTIATTLTSLFGEDLSTNAKLAVFLINNFSNQTVRNFLLSIPLGVVKPLTPGGATILKEEGRGESQNFLNRTPFNLLTRDVCGKVIYDFENDEGLKYWSLPQVASRERASLGGAPYSMESLENSTLAKNLDIILHSPISTEKKAPYLFCKTLQYSPAQVSGLDQRLMTYIRPDQAQIMFELINDKLRRGNSSDCKDGEFFSRDGSRDQCCGSFVDGAGQIVEYCNLVGEKPPALIGLIDYLTKQTPVTALGDMAQVANQIDVLEDHNIDLKPYADFATQFLSTSIVNLMLQSAQNRDFLTTPIIDTICNEPPAGWCSKKIPDEVNEVLNKIRQIINQKPVDLISSKLSYPLIDCSGDKCAWSKSFSIMDWLAKQYDFLGNPYVDTLGSKLGLDVEFFKLDNKIQDTQDLIDESSDNIKENVTDFLNKNLIERPAHAVMTITAKIASLVGIETGDNLANQVTGACRTVFNEVACKDDPNQVYRAQTATTPAQCCDLGANLACKSRCEIKPNNKRCKEEIGQKQETILGEDMCCFPAISTSEGEKCKTYRVISAIDAARGCREDEKDEDDKDQKEEIEVNGKKVMACYKLKTRVTEEDTVLGETFLVRDDCCTTVVDCVADQFAEHIAVLGDTMSHGSLPLDDLTSKRGGEEDE